MDSNMSYTNAPGELDGAAAVAYSGYDAASDPYGYGGATDYDADGSYDVQQEIASEPHYDPTTGAYYYYNADGSVLQFDATRAGSESLAVQPGDTGYDAYASNWGADNNNNINEHEEEEGDGSGNYYDSYDGYEYDEATGQYTQSPTVFDDATPLDPLEDEAYWEQERYNYDPADAAAASAAAFEDTVIADDDRNKTDQVGDEPASSAPSDPSTAPHDARESVPTQHTPKGSTRSKASSPTHKKPKSKTERMQKRQELLEKEEADKLQQQQQQQQQQGAGSSNVPGATAGASPSARVARKPATFLEREKAKIHLQIRKARAIARKRMPVQVRILTQTRQHLSPLEKYFGSRSVDAALSDIFWAALKGDVRRVRHLVEVERVSSSDSKLDPWNMQQTPLHWAAKGGSRDVIEYLIGAGAAVRCLDENGSFPLHLACWAGHVDATLALLKAGDVRDLYIQDFDAAFAPLDWASVRGHTHLLRAIEKYEDSLWLPKFIDDLIRGIVRYKIKLFNPPPKPAKLTVTAIANAAAAAQAVLAKPDDAAVATTAATDPSPTTAPVAAAANPSVPSATAPAAGSDRNVTK